MDAKQKNERLAEMKHRSNYLMGLFVALAVLTTVLFCYIPEEPDGSLVWCTRFALVKMATVLAGWYAYRTLGEVTEIDDKIKELEK